MRPTCRVVAMRLPSVDDVADLSPRLAEHASTCLRCQAEAARYRSLNRGLGALEDVTYAAPDGFVAAVMDRLSQPLTDVVALRHRLIPSPAAVAATAGAAVVAIVVLRRLQAPV